MGKNNSAGYKRSRTKGKGRQYERDTATKFEDKKSSRSAMNDLS